MDPKVLEKLKTLREYYYDDGYALKYIDAVETNIRRLVATESLLENKAVAAIVDDAKGRIKVINQMLTMDENLKDDERAKLYRERNVHQFYLDRFEGRNIEQRFDSINSILDQEVERITTPKSTP